MLVRLPGGEVVPLESLVALPVGTTIDVREGTVNLKVSDGKGGTDAGLFTGGIFKFDQRTVLIGGKPRLVTDIKLVAGDFSACPGRRRSAGNQRSTAESSRRRVVRYIQAKAHGSFNVIGKNASGLERGTTWATTDTCTTTEVKVVVGVVAVTDFAEKRTVNVKAPRTYIADTKPRRRR